MRADHHNTRGPVVLRLQLDDAQLDAIAARLTDRLGTQSGTVAAWLTAEDAGRYIGYTDTEKGRGRIYDLKALGEIECAKDGRRLLVKRSSLDAYLTK